MKAVLFDLDGTLADTARDLARALNRLRGEQGLPPLPYEQVRPVASHGARGLIGLGFGLSPEAPDFEPLRLAFLDYYQQDLVADTVLFDGIVEVLHALAARGLPWGIVTNKLARFAEPLMAALELPVAPGVIVSGDTVGVAKPDPRPMLHAAQVLQVDPADCLYVGDAERDVEAGRAVGMKTLVALYGYLSATDQPAAWGADGLIAHPQEILDWL